MSGYPIGYYWEKHVRPGESLEQKIDRLLADVALIKAHLGITGIEAQYEWERHLAQQQQEASNSETDSIA